MELIPPWEDPNDSSNKSVPTKPPIAIVVGKPEPAKQDVPEASPIKEPPPNKLRATTIKSSQAETKQASGNEMSDNDDSDELLEDKNSETGSPVTRQSSSDSSSSDDSSDSSSSSDESYIPPTPRKKKAQPQTSSNHPLFIDSKFYENLDDGMEISESRKLPDKSKKKHRAEYHGTSTVLSKLHRKRHNPICPDEELTPSKSLFYSKFITRPGYCNYCT